MSDRRIFLQGLATLPLIGGTVALVSIDPIFAAIEKHRAANLAFLAANEVPGARVVDIPDDIEAAIVAASWAEVEARHDMHEVVPTTLAGLMGYVAYWEKYLTESLTMDEVGWEAVPTIAEALRTISMGGANV